MKNEQVENKQKIKAKCWQKLLSMLTKLPATDLLFVNDIQFTFVFLCYTVSLISGYNLNLNCLLYGYLRLALSVFMFNSGSYQLLQMTFVNMNILCFYSITVTIPERTFTLFRLIQKAIFFFLMTSKLNNMYNQRIFHA